MMPPIFKLYKSRVIRKSECLYIAPSGIHGYGVFSKIAIRKSSVIEVAPVLIGTAKDYELLSETAIRDYYFLLADDKCPVAIGLGFSSWYNHACPANATYTIDKNKMLISIKAASSIRPHEEITINYHGKYNCDLPTEF